MSIKNVIEKRIATRLSQCRQSAHAAIEILHRSGVRAVPFGSAARGTVHAGSDLDILVLDRGKLRRGAILALAEEAACVPVDVLFAEDITPRALKLILEDIARDHHIG